MNNAYKKQVTIVLALSALLILVWGVYHYAKKNGGVNTEEQSKQTLPYLHGDNSFLFRFPKDLKFSNSAEDVDGETQETVVFNSADPKKGLQIFIAPFDSKDELSIDNIKSSNPDLDVSDARDMTLDGAKGFGFLSKTKGSNFSTFEIWFLHDGKIYQISTYPEYKDTVIDFISSWKWQ